MQGLHAVTRTLSAGYAKACIEVQGLVKQSLEKITSKDRDFMAGASTALCWWVKAIQPAIDCLGKSMAEQSQLLEDAWKARMNITKDILALCPKEDKMAMANPINDLMNRAFAVARAHMEEAFLVLHSQLPALVHKHVPLAQAGVFLAAIFQVMCKYRQETDNMILSQMIMLAQVIPNIWGV